jgi:non-ribosomal peptide synthetase component F
VPAGERFIDLLARVRATAIDVLHHDAIPFERIVDEVAPRRDPSRSPLFQVMMVYQSAPPPQLALDGLGVTLLDIERSTAKYDLTLTFEPTPRGMTAMFEYSTDLFEHVTIERLLDRLDTLLAAVAATPDLSIDRLPLLDAATRDALIAQGDSRRSYPRDRTVHRLFEDRAARHPDAVAVVSAAGQLSYGELDRRANQLARYLLATGIGPGACIGLFVPRSLDLVVAMLAVLKAGGAYVPLDHSYPVARLAFLVSDARLDLLVTAEPVPIELASLGVPSICLADDEILISLGETEALPDSVDAGALAYVMYTSGSTGQPKGVGVVHRAIVRLVIETDLVPLGPDTACLQLGSRSMRRRSSCGGRCSTAAASC